MISKHTLDSRFTMTGVLARVFCFMLLWWLMAGCGKRDIYPVYGGMPYEGFKWEHVKGGCLDFMAQRSDKLHIIVDKNLPGAVLVDSSGQRIDTLMRVFPLEGDSIAGLLRILRQQPGWNDDEMCRFREVSSGVRGTARYVLVPAGEYADSVNKLMLDTPVPSTCSGWGIGNSGMRYFETFSSCPGKVLFVEIGQEIPLFDEESIRLGCK